VSYRCADPQKSFGQIEGSIESRSVRSCRNRECYGKQVQCLLYQHLVDMVGPNARIVIPWTEYFEC
jgi:hypothetical protein